MSVLEYYFFPYEQAGRGTLPQLTEHSLRDVVSVGSLGCLQEDTVSLHIPRCIFITSVHGYQHCVKHTYII